MKVDKIKGEVIITLTLEEARKIQDKINAIGDAVGEMRGILDVLQYKIWLRLTKGEGD